MAVYDRCWSNVLDGTGRTNHPVHVALLACCTVVIRFSSCCCSSGYVKTSPLTVELMAAFGLMDSCNSNQMEVGTGGLWYLLVGWSLSIHNGRRCANIAHQSVSHVEQFGPTWNMFIDLAFSNCVVSFILECVLVLPHSAFGLFLLLFWLSSIWFGLLCCYSYCCLLPSTE